MSRRARCGIPQRLIPFQPCALGAKRLRWSPASAWDLHCFSQRAPCPLVNTCGLCQNNANARRLPTGSMVDMPPWLRLRGMCSFSLWTKHYRQLSIKLNYPLRFCNSPSSPVLKFFSCNTPGIKKIFQPGKNFFVFNLCF